MQQRAFDNEKIEFIWSSEVIKIGGAVQITGVTQRETVTGAEHELPLNGLFVAIGHDPRCTVAAMRGQQTPDGHYNLERMLSDILRQGDEILCCDTCRDAQGMSEDMLISGVCRSKINELADLTFASDKTLVY